MNTARISFLYLAEKIFDSIFDHHAATYDVAKDAAQFILLITRNRCSFA